MKGKLFVIAFAVLAVVAGALTFGPQATNASAGIKPSPTPRRTKAAPRKPSKTNSVFQGMNVNPIVKKGQGTTTSVPTNQYAGTPTDGTGIKQKPPKKQFKPSPESNGMVKAVPNKRRRRQ